MELELGVTGLRLAATVKAWAGGRHLARLGSRRRMVDGVLAVLTTMQRGGANRAEHARQSSSFTSVLSPDGLLPLGITDGVAVILNESPGRVSGFVVGSPMLLLL